MYTWEIDDIMKKYNYNIPSSIYIKLCKSSPQINYISRIDDSKYKITVVDDNNTSREWVFSIFCDTE